MHVHMHVMSSCMSCIKCNKSPCFQYSSEGTGGLECCQPAGIIRCLGRKEHCFKSQSYTLRQKSEWHCVCACARVCAYTCIHMYACTHYVIYQTFLLHWNSATVVCVCAHFAAVVWLLLSWQ